MGKGQEIDERVNIVAEKRNTENLECWAERGEKTKRGKRLNKEN